MMKVLHVNIFNEAERANKRQYPKRANYRFFRFSVSHLLCFCVRKGSAVETGIFFKIKVSQFTSKS